MHQRPPHPLTRRSVKAPEEAFTVRLSTLRVADDAGKWEWPRSEMDVDEAEVGGEMEEDATSPPPNPQRAKKKAPGGDAGPPSKRSKVKAGSVASTCSRCLPYVPGQTKSLRGEEMENSGPSDNKNTGLREHTR